MCKLRLLVQLLVPLQISSHCVKSTTDNRLHKLWAQDLSIPGHRPFFLRIFCWSQTGDRPEFDVEKLAMIPRIRILSLGSSTSSMHRLMLSPNSIKMEPIWVWVTRTLPLTFCFHTYNLRTYGHWLTPYFSKHAVVHLLCLSVEGRKLVKEESEMA